jgi:hypothetical protein
MEDLSLWQLCEGNLEGGLLYREPRRLCIEMGPHSLGNMEGRSFLRAVEKKNSLKGGFL